MSANKSAIRERGQRTGLMDKQEKSRNKQPQKGVRGQAEGIRSKKGVEPKIPDTPKKPGRQKQTASARRQNARRTRPAVEAA